MSRSIATAVTGAFACLGLAGCYVVPIHPEPLAGTPAAVIALPAVPPAPIRTSMTARLYPANELAAQRGMLVGSVVTLSDGRGRFVLDYDGDRLSGEATRVRGDERRGIANAYGARGTFMSCDYRMATPTRGTGTCALSDGARYSVHLGD
jgi:hypothetical protein